MSRLLGLLAWAAVRTLLALAGATLVAATALWAWSGTLASLEWGWHRFAQPRGLQAEGLAGSLRHGLHARRLRVQAGTIEVEMWDVALAWDLRALLEGQVRVTGARAGQVQLRPRDPPAGPHAPRPTIPQGPRHGPWQVHIEHLAIERLAWAGAWPLQARDLAVRYHLDAAQGAHHLELTHAVAGGGRYHGALRWTDGTRGPVAGWLAGEAQAPHAGKASPHRLGLWARVQGRAADLALELQLRPLAAGAAPSPSVDLSARLTPRRAPYVAAARAKLRHLDLSMLWPAGPRTGIDGSIDITPEPVHGRSAEGGLAHGSGWRVDLNLANARPGAWDQQRLPLAQLRATGTWRPGAARARTLQARFGPDGNDGSIEGGGRWDAGRGLDLDLRIARLRPDALHSALSAGSGTRFDKALEGELRARGLRDTTRFELALRTALHARPASGTNRAAEPATAKAGRHAWTLEALEVSGQWHAGRLQMEGGARGEMRLRRLPVRLEVQALLAREAGPAAPWTGSIRHLQLAAPDPSPASGAWTLRLVAPVAVRVASGAGVVAGAGQAVLSAPARRGLPPAQLAWEPVQWRRGEFHSRGHIDGLALAWLALSGRVPPQGNMVFDARWEIHLARTLRLSVQVERVRGDITLLAETLDGLPTRVQAGVREARLGLETSGEAVRLLLRWSSDRAGQVQGELVTQLARGGAMGWHWPAQAPLAGGLRARLPRIAAWSALAPPGWRVRGSLAADIEIGGTRTRPRLVGPVRADDLALRSIVDGIALEGGRLRARLDDRQLRVDELRWETGPEGGKASGTLLASGVAGWAPAGAARPEGPYAQFVARLDRLRASVRDDRQVTLSGGVSGDLEGSQVSLRGQLHVDRARIEVSDPPAPSLGDDVVVHHLPAGAAAAWRPTAPATHALRLDVEVDLGRDARVAGRGIDTGVQGRVRVSGDSFDRPRLVGTVRAVNGRYTAYGQPLELQRGILRFTGAHDDPALDVLAVRADLDRPVGVQVTGRAKAPVFRLWSQSPATEAEKLSWLVLGRGAAAGGAETVLLEQAAVALLARRAGLGQGGIAAAFGLDELTVRGGGGEQGAAITLGKRLGRRLYAAYERTLSGAVGTLHVFLDLSDRLTLRAEAGDRTGVDLIYAISFDGAPAR